MCTDMKENNLENNQDACFSPFQKDLVVALDILTLQDEHNIYIYIYLHIFT
jgi:hypothetical protein